MLDLSEISSKHIQKHFIYLFPAWVLFSLMYAFLVSSEIMLSSLMLFTFLACVLLTYVRLAGGE